MSGTDVAGLVARLQAVEDRLEILNLVAGHPASADTGSGAYSAAMYAEDAVLDRGANLEGARGRDTLVEGIRSPAHMAAIESGMAHVSALPHIRIEGDRAVVTCYLQILTPNKEGPEATLSNHGASRGYFVHRLTANRWELVRTPDGWRVLKRIIRPIGTEEARALLHRGIDTHD